MKVASPCVKKEKMTEKKETVHGMKKTMNMKKGYPLIGIVTQESQKCPTKNSEFAILILILEYTHWPLGACPSGSWLESYAAFRTPRERVFQCQSQKTLCGNMADTDGIDTLSSKEYTDVLHGIEEDGTVPQRSRDNG
jgi:hypothetical protein